MRARKCGRGLAWPAVSGASPVGWIRRSSHTYPAATTKTVSGIWTSMNCHTSSPVIEIASNTPGYSGHQYSQMWRNQ